MNLMSTKLERAKLASLETISANIMIADETLNILYVNGATRRLLDADSGNSPDGVPIKNRTPFRHEAGRDSDK